MGKKNTTTEHETVLITTRHLFYWILRKHRWMQFFLLLIILVSLFFRVFPLEMQKRIINEAIHLKQLDLLYLYCGLYIGAVVLAGISKYAINVMQTILGQKILVEIRNELYDHVLQLPLQFYRKMQPGTVISAMTSELNSIGFFLGGAIAIPVTSILTFAVFLWFMFSLSPLLALLSVGIYPLELIVIPLLQKKYNRLNKERIKTTRLMANMVNETISGIHEIHSNASYELEKKRMGIYIRSLFKVLKRLFFVKYGIKFANNLFQSFGPFILFLVGGYLAINGQFTLGALVAFLSAYEKVYDPWKEMLEYYQSLQDAMVSYRQIMQTFDLQPEHLLLPPGREVRKLAGDIKMQNAGFMVGSGVKLLDRINLHIKPKEQVALVGFSGSGKSTLALLMAQLYDVTSGTVLLDNHDIAELSKADISHNVTMIAQHPFIFSGTIRDNLLYGARALHREGEEFLSREKVLQAIHDVGLADDVMRFGLQTILTPEQGKVFIDKILNMRRIIGTELHDQFAEEIEFYDINNFLYYTTIRNNIVCGDSADKRFTIENLVIDKDKEFSRLLQATGVEPLLLELGKTIASQTVELLKNFADDDFFFRNTPMLPAEFDQYRELMERRQDNGKCRDRHDRKLIMTLALRYIPKLHTVGELSAELQEKIMDTRRRFLQEIGCASGEYGVALKQMSEISVSDQSIEELCCNEGDKGFTPYCPGLYLATHTLLDNIIFGTVKSGRRLTENLQDLAYKVFTREGLLDDIIDIGLNFDVGSKGDRLSGGQQQKLAIARAFLRDTDILIMDEATASLDNASQARIQEILDNDFRGRKTVISVIHRLDFAQSYDRIYVLKNGLIIEQGNYRELMDARGAFFQLTQGN
jgi:putative ABC transport system ATP-binding protein